jgi:hypothetical protein
MTGLFAPIAIVVGLIVSVVGAIDAVRSGEYDLLAVLLALALVFTALLASGSTRGGWRLRADLARWVHHRAALTGETTEHITNRAVAAYRSELEPRRDMGPAPPSPRGDAS